MDAGYFDKMKKLLHVGTVQKELVDPYCTVNFAGHKGKTKVIWNEQDPEWNTQLNLGIRVSYIAPLFIATPSSLVLLACTSLSSLP